MKVYIESDQWEEWDLDDPSKHEVACSAFYLGHNAQMVDALLTGQLSADIGRRMIEDAIDMGLQPFDTLEKI